MIIYHLKDLMLKKSVEIGKKLTYSDIVKETGVSTITLTRMGAKAGHKVNVDIIEKLCRYFACTPNDLMTIVPDPEEGKAE